MSITRKFRGKRKDNGEWVKGFPFVRRNINGEVIDCFIIQEAYEQVANGQRYVRSNLKSECFRVIPKTIRQSTGLTDKNGKEIFEEDIIKTHYANAQKADFIETVVFHNGKFCGFYENNGCKQWTILYDGVPHLAIDKSVYMDSVEVIGNIHDNPELLKGGAEK